MKILLTERKLIELCITLIILALTTSYMWDALPQMDDSLRLLIVFIAVILILLLSYSLSPGAIQNELT